MRTTSITNNMALAAILITLGGCASIVKAPDHLDEQAKEFKADPNLSQVYLYRNETLGAALSMPVTVDGKLAGSTGANSYFRFYLPAGEHTFTSQEGESSLTIETVVNKLYFIWQEVKMGFMSGGSKLQLVNSSQGRNGVLESTLIDSPIGKQP